MCCINVTGPTASDGEKNFNTFDTKRTCCIYGASGVSIALRAHTYAYVKSHIRQHVVRSLVTVWMSVKFSWDDRDRVTAPVYARNRNVKGRSDVSRAATCRAGNPPEKPVGTSVGRGSEHAITRTLRFRYNRGESV